MAEVRKRKAAIALATRMANVLVDNNGHAPRDARSMEDVERAIRKELARARQSFNDQVIPERRGEGLLETAILAKLKLSPEAEPKGLAPKVVDLGPLDITSTDGSYRDAPPAREIKLKPSRLLPPPSPLAQMRNRLLLGAGWIVAVLRFASAIRANGVNQLALLQGVLGTLAVLPIVLGVLLLILPKR